MPLFEVKELKRRRGFGYGLRQRGLVAKFAQGPASLFPSAEQSARLIERLQPLLVVENGSPLSLVHGAVLSVLDVMQWAGYVQRHARIPIFADPRILSARPPAQDQQSVIGILPYVEIEATRISLLWAQALANDFAAAVQSGDPASVLDAIPERVSEMVAKLKPWAPGGVNSYRIAQAAFEETIPFRLLGRDILALGEGVHLKRMKSTITDEASAIGVAIARNKMLTALALRQSGLPGARHHVATSEDHAVTLARETGFPTVVKPADSDGGAGVAAGLMTEDAVRAAYREALKHSKVVLVETFVPGHNYRVTVCHGRIVKTTVRRAGGVVGDGVSSVADLVASHRTNAQAQFRRIERGRDLLTLDDEALDMLAESGMTADSVPGVAEYVALRRRSNVSTGGSTTAVSGQLHPDNEQLFLRTAHLLGLDLAAIDYISPDITRSWHDVPSGICEVNAQPQLSNDLNPRIYHDVLREYLGPDPRIPWTVILGDSDLDDHARALAERIRELAASRCAPAVMACGDGVWSGQSRVSSTQENPFDHWEAAAVGRFAASAVVVAEGQHLLASGLPSDLIDFLVLMPSRGVTQRDQQLLAACLTLAVPHVQRGIVVDAEDAALSALKSQLAARYFILVSTAPPTDQMRAHLSAGCRAAWIGERTESGAATVIFADGAKETSLGRLETAGIDDRSLGAALIARVIRSHLPQRAQKPPAVR